MFIRGFVFLFIFLNFIYSSEKELVSIVRTDNLSVYSKNIADDKYKVDSYSKGKVLKLDRCDKYNWCKVKDKELYLSKILLGIMEIKKDNKNKKLIKKLEQTLSKENIVKSEEKTKQNKKKPIKKQETKPKKKKTSCVKLKQIDLSENKIFDKNTQNKKFKNYINNCISGKLLKNIIDITSSYYLNKGYITTKPYLKEQDITDGQIDITILEGKVENIIHNKTKKSSWKIATAFVGQKDKILNLRDLETSLEMMNRVESADSNFELKPGKESGGSIVEIKTKESLPIHLSLGYSGRGTSSENDKDITGILTIDNLVGINDILVYTDNGSKIQEHYQSTKAKELNYSFPIGSYVLDFTKSKSSYRRGITGINATYLSNGITRGTKFAISKVLTRDQTNKVEIKTSIYHKDSKNYFENNLIEVSSYRTTLFQIDFMHTNYKPWGQLYTVYSFYQGKDWFGAMDDVQLNGESDYSDSAKLEFTKYSINNTLYYYFTNRTYNISSNQHIQYTKDKLYNSDQLTVGSAYTVRGYNSSNYYGNNGYYIKNDFTKTFSPNIHDNIFKDISIFVGLDGGKVRCQSDNVGICGELYGKSIGFKTSSNNLNSNFTWSRPMKSLRDSFDKQTLFNFNITLKL